jgi:hypothetical protein
MPQLLIVTDAPRNSGEVVYRERIASSDLESAHFSGQLIERVGWAVGDANAIEHRSTLQSVPKRTTGLEPASQSQARTS